MKDLVSVVLPTYNRERTLHRAINSVLQQTYHEIELIVVDDGSTDQTRSVVQAYKDERIRYIYQPNQGACVARNRGVSEARGLYIAFQDSDDEWMEDKLERQMAYMEQTQADVVFHAFWRHGLEAESERIPSETIPSRQVFFEDIVPVNMISTQTILGKKTCFQEEQFNPAFPRYQDWELGMRLVRKYKVFYDSAELAYVYVSPDSISKKPELALQSAFGIVHSIATGHKEIVAQFQRVEDRVRELETELASARKLIDTYNGSTSWRITAPLRWISQRVRKSLKRRIT